MDIVSQRADVRLERKGDALWLWIDREERRNALNSAVLKGIAEAVERAGTDASIRAIVITGVGEKAFCAGADLAKGTETFQAGPEEPTTDFGRLARSVRMCGVPIIGRINGACVAGGMGLASLCDLVVCADHARFGLPEVKVGVFPMQVLVFLRGQIGARHVNELCLTGDLVSAARAAEMGLVNQVVPYRALDEAVDALIAKLRGGSPTALKRGKQAIFAMEMMAFHEALAFAEAQIALVSRTKDAEEGLAAFNEKRKPRWAEDSGS
ncbi:MAG TPA: enoyl-CoA hydratase-related protein [Caulobacterales bacterium]|nr:enoyl-CoA hydratase-related protein [Caulobacterales bacterium]